MQVQYVISAISFTARTHNLVRFQFLKTKVGAPIPVHVPHSIVMYQSSTFWKENVHHWYMMVEWGTWMGMGAPTLT